MRLTKDEFRIIHACITEQKYNLAEDLSYSKTEAHDIIQALNALEEKIYKFSDDTRRKGRTSQNSFADTIKRFTKLHLNSQTL